MSDLWPCAGSASHKLCEEGDTRDADGEAPSMQVLSRSIALSVWIFIDVEPCVLVEISEVESASIAQKSGL